MAQKLIVLCVLLLSGSAAAETVHFARHGDWIAACEVDDITDKYTCWLASVVEQIRSPIDKHNAVLQFNELNGTPVIAFGIEPSTLKEDKSVILRVDRNQPINVKYDLNEIKEMADKGETRNFPQAFGECMNDTLSSNEQIRCIFESSGSMSMDGNIFYSGATNRILIEQFKKGRRVIVRYKSFFFGTKESTAIFSLIGFSKAYEKFLLFKNQQPQYAK